MEKHNYIAIETICQHHQVPDSFIISLSEVNLIDVFIIEESKYISQRQLADLERFVRLHRDLEINSAGIDVINHLMQKLANMQEEMNLLKARLALYEPES